MQEQLSVYSRDIRSVQAKIANIQRDTRANEVTANHVVSLAPNLKTYRTVGKTFVLTTREEIESRLDNEHGDLIKQQRDLLDRKEYLERRISSTTSNMRDLAQGA